MNAIKRVAYACLMLMASLQAQTISIEQGKLKYEGSDQYTGVVKTFETKAGTSYQVFWNQSFPNVTSPYGIKLEVYNGSTILSSSGVLTTTSSHNLSFIASGEQTKIKFSNQAPNGVNMVFHLDDVRLNEKQSASWSLTGTGSLSQSLGTLYYDNSVSNQGIKKTYSTVPGHQYKVEVKLEDDMYAVQLKSKELNGNWNSEVVSYTGEEELSYEFVAQSDQSEVYMLFQSGGPVYEISKVVITDLDEVKYMADVSQHGLYYPFGMQEPGTYFDGAYRYRFNGMEKEGEVAENTYGTYFRYLDTRIGKWYSLDPKTNASISLYSAMEGNPVWYMDPMGDSIEVGNSKDKEYNEVFRDFARSKEGINFLKDYAKKGQVIAGVKYEKDGKYHDKKINLSVSYLIWGGGMGDTKAMPKDENGYTKIRVRINGNFNKDGSVERTYIANTRKTDVAKSNAYKKVSLAITTVHELFIHADLYAQSIADNKPLYSNVPKKYHYNGRDEYHHNYIWDQANKSKFGIEGYRYLVKAKNKYRPQLTNDQLWGMMLHYYPKFMQK